MSQSRTIKPGAIYKTIGSSASALLGRAVRKRRVRIFFPHPPLGFIELAHVSNHPVGPGHNPDHSRFRPFHRGDVWCVHQYSISYLQLLVVNPPAKASSKFGQIASQPSSPETARSRLFHSFTGSIVLPRTSALCRGGSLANFLPAVK